MMSDEQIAHLGRRSTEFSVGEQVPGTPYLVVSQIGQGGMGSVYEVEHRELGKRFVLKALLDQFCQREDLVQRLRNEWRSLGRLEHPNIVSVSDAGMATNGAPFYVMERLQGESLANALGRLGRLTLLDSMRLAAEVLEGLAAAHEIGIVHRDVKPPNIFITQTGAAKLLDFGIAKLTDGASLELTGRGIAIGTPRYMSPEQAAGEKVDGRADLYAVGLVLFEMLCGNGPFDGCESHEVFLAHITRQPPRLSDLLEGIPPELDGLVAGLLAKRPYERPQSAGTAAAALRSMLRTYRSLEQAPDTRAEELDGVLTPLVQGEFVQALAQGQNPRAGLAAFPVSGNGPTASVSQVPQLFARHGASPSFPTPPFNVRSATPPFDARGSTPPFEARSTPSGYERGPSATPATDSLGHPSSRGWSVAPATRTAHPEAG
jgi:serine/threonine protein kinase